ncbi:MAG TPA: DUF5684 domain-containing protein [Galbitalea sp.]|nr:DUF5684 domain-containing protein [Galbitalea sp.]
MFESVARLLDATHSSLIPTTTSVATGVVAYLLFAFALWPVLVKSGRHGWGAFIPFYNTYLMEELAGFRGWLAILFYVPVVNLVMGILVARGNGKAFAKGAGFSFWMLWVLPILGYAILGLGKAKYIGDGGRTAHHPAASATPSA